MGPIQLMCLLHPGAAAAAAVAVVYSVWVVERQQKDTGSSNRPRNVDAHEQNQQEMQRQQQQLTQMLKRQQQQQHKRVPNQDTHLSHPPDGQSLQGAHVRSSADEGPEQSAPNLGQLGIIFQRPPLDYDTRIPVLRTHSALPATTRAFVPASVAVRHRPQPPSIPQPLQSGLAYTQPGLPIPHSPYFHLSGAAPAAAAAAAAAGLAHRTQPGPPIPHPAATILSGASSNSARQLPLKLLATATAVLLGAAAFPATFSTITQRLHNQQQEQQSAGLPNNTPSAMSAGRPPVSSSSSSSSSSRRSSSDGTKLGHAQSGNRPTHSTPIGRKQFSVWMQQQLPTILQQKREELQRLQGLQGLVGSMQDSSRGVLQANSAGRELSVVFGALQGCLGEEVESLQIQVGALEAVQQTQ